MNGVDPVGLLEKWVFYEVFAQKYGIDRFATRSRGYTPELMDFWKNGENTGKTKIAASWARGEVGHSS
jgi:hypothetical protein